MESSSTIRLGVALRMWTFILTTVLLVSGAAAQDESKYPAFVFPANGSNLIFNKLDTVMVTFTSGFPNAILYTFCVPGTGQMSESTPLCAAPSCMCGRGVLTMRHRHSLPSKGIWLHLQRAGVSQLHVGHALLVQRQIHRGRHRGRPEQRQLQHHRPGAQHGERDVWAG